MGGPPERERSFRSRVTVESAAAASPQHPPRTYSCTIEASLGTSAAAEQPTRLWRGMRNLDVGDKFLANNAGGFYTTGCTGSADVTLSVQGWVPGTTLPTDLEDGGRIFVQLPAADSSLKVVGASSSNSSVLKAGTPGALLGGVSYLPATIGEHMTLALMVFVASSIWAYLLACVVSIITSMNPHQVAWQQEMDK